MTRRALPVLILKKNHIRMAVAAVSCGSIAGFCMPVWVVLVALIGSFVAIFRWRFAVIITIMLGIGVLRGMTLIKGALPEESQHLRGIVLEESTAGMHSAVLRLDDGRMIIVNGTYAATVRFGDEIGFSCTGWTWTTKLEKPRCRIADVHTLATGKAGSLRSVLQKIKTMFEGSIRRTLPNPEAPLLSGLLLGSRDEIPSELKQDFRTSGTSHIVAVSGFNVTVVVTLIASLLRFLPLPRGVRLVCTWSSIAGFVVLTGSSPSVVRAGIMGSLVVLGRETGRLSDALHTLIVSAAVMVFVDPTIVASVGFQLSVAATLGLVLLSVPIEGRLTRVPSSFGIRGSLSTTLAAIAVTQPLIMLYFGQLSVIAPITNLVVLPLIPVAMLSGFCVIVISALVPASSVFIGWVAWAPLAAIIRAVELCAHLPFASLMMNTTVANVAAGIWAATVSYAFIQTRKHHEVT